MATIDASKMDRYVNGKLVKEGKKEELLKGKFYWWDAEGDEMANQIAATINFIKDHQSARVEQLTASTRLYGNSSAFNFIGPALSRSASSSANSQSNRISFNLCAAVIDTITSKVAKNKVIPKFITSGGVWGMQKKAENLDKFLEGCFHAHNIQKVKALLMRDAAVWGTGAVHIFRKGNDIGVERAFPHEFEVDEVEALESNPQQLHRIKLVSRDLLMDMFKDDEEALEKIVKQSPSNVAQMGGAGTVADLLTVKESWHLKSGEDADDGVHAITLDSGSLLKEPYDKDYFPFVFLHYCKRLMGFWGQGACERLQNLQGEINRLMILDQRSRWMMASFKILVENGSKVVSQHLNNEVGTIIHYTGTPPQYVTPPAIDPSNELKIDSLIAKGFQQEGVSQLAASSLKPQGVDSGAAMRTYDEIGDDRLLFIGQEVETAVLEIGHQMIEVAKEIYKDRKTFKVVFPQANFMETIDWKDVKLKEDEYILKAYPTSTLPDDPSGRLQTIQEYMQAGLITPRAGRRLMTMPDVEMSDKLANSAEELICKILEDMIFSEDGIKYRAPEPYMDLQLAKQIVIEYQNYADLNNAPEEVMAMLAQFSSQIDDLTGINKVQPPMPAQPMANPNPTPTSPLLQNTNNQGVA